MNQIFKTTMILFIVCIFFLIAHAEGNNLNVKKLKRFIRVLEM